VRQVHRGVDAAAYPDRHRNADMPSQWTPKSGPTRPSPIDRGKCTPQRDASARRSSEGSRRHDPPQLRYRQARPMLGQQATGPQPAAAVAAVACHLQQGEVPGDLAESDDTGRRGSLTPDSSALGRLFQPLAMFSTGPAVRLMKACSCDKRYPFGEDRGGPCRAVSGQIPW
jgi:hypothetical protein